jgi:hypothetical protein
MQCPTSEWAASASKYKVHVEDTGVYVLRCDQGHETSTCLQEQKFEVLFEIGIHAIVDGYYREAVSSFTAALERFYEFYLSAICAKRSIQEDLFKQTWKTVANQSERQLGAFIFTYLLEEQSAPPLLSEASVSFRNAVIHKGRIPRKNEAISFGEKVLSLIVPVLRVLKARDREHVDMMVRRHIRQTQSLVPDGHKQQFLTMPTVISIVRADSESQPSVAEAIKNAGYARWRELRRGR